MELTFVTDLGQTFTIEIDPNLELESVMALLEAESGVPIDEQSISFNGRELLNPKATVRECVDGENAMLLFRRKVPALTGHSVPYDSEMMRLLLLGNPDLVRQLEEAQPEVVEAARSNPERFAELLRQTPARQNEAEVARQREALALSQDPLNVEAQRRIEEAIRQQAVNENMAHALEYSPEAFGKVTMLYVPVEINGYPVKAFVDTGAQQTIINPETAEACGIMRLLDTRYGGVVVGVGAAKILGRVHAAQLKLADVHIPCSFTVVEGWVNVLFGLDMLKAHQACIDLERNVLRIQGREVTFLPEHELPERVRMEEAGIIPLEASGSAGMRSSQGGSNPAHAGSLAGSSRGGPVASRSQRGAQSSHSEESIQTLIGLGASREQAIASLDIAGGNLDSAASLLF